MWVGLPQIAEAFAKCVYINLKIQAKLNVREYGIRARLGEIELEALMVSS